MNPWCCSFTGRVSRLFLAELLQRLDLPTVELAPVSSSARGKFLAALRSADKLDWQPLINLWKQRIEAAS